MITCAFGRALDFAVAWTGILRGVAAEAKPGASHLVAWLGPQLGLISYELLVATPAIFAGRWLARQRGRRVGLLSFVGAVSPVAAAFNSRFLL